MIDENRESQPVERTIRILQFAAKINHETCYLAAPYGS